MLHYRIRWSSSRVNFGLIRATSQRVSHSKRSVFACNYGVDVSATFVSRRRALISKPYNITRVAYCAVPTKRELSVFRKGGMYSPVIGNEGKALPVWHDPKFMEADPLEKELWLETQIKGSACSNVLLDVDAYNFVIKSWAREASSNNAAAFHAEKWLIRMRQSLESPMLHNGALSPPSDDCLPTAVRPNVESYNAVLEAWSKSNSEVIAVLRAERWLDELRKLKSIRTDSSPEKRNSLGIEKGSSVDDLDTNLGPTTESYNFFLATCAKGLGKTKKDLQANAVKAEQTLSYMITQWRNHDNFREAPDTNSFNYVMTAVTKCKSDPTVVSRVMEWLRMMESFQRSSFISSNNDNINHHIRANTKSYSIAINAWGILAQQKAVASARERRRYRTLRGVQLQKGRAIADKVNPSFQSSDDGHDEVQKAKAILNYMHDLSKAGVIEVKPDTFTYNSVIGAWSKISSEYSEDAPFRAEEVFRDMMELFDQGSPNVTPDLFSYTQIIHAWTKLKSIQSTKRAEWWLRKMWNAYNDESLELDDRQKRMPNSFTYNIIIKSWCDLNEIKRADSLLRELISLELQQSHYPKPNSDSYALLISAWTAYELRSTEDQAGAGLENAFRLLKDMIEKEDNIHPDISTTLDLYNNVLKSASESLLRSNRVFDIAAKTFNLLDKSRHTPDHMSYKFLLQTGIKVLRNPQDEAKRSNFIKVVMKRCCDNGQLCKGVVLAVSGFAQTIKEVIEWPPPKSCSRNITNPQLIPGRSDFANRYSSA